MPLGRGRERVMPGRNRTWPLWVALAVYYAAVVALHEVVQQGLRLLVHRWSFVGYEWRVVALWLAVALPLLTVGAVRLWRAGARRDLALLIGWLLLTAALDSWVLSTESERIHYLQYAVVSLALRHLLGGPWSALALASLLGVVDEGYQAAVLYRHRPDLPMDVKDVGLNIVGALGGLLAHRVITCRSPRPPRDHRVNT